MMISSPRGWPYSAASSPGPLPNTSWIQTLREIHPLTNNNKLQFTSNKILSKIELYQWVNSHNIFDAAAPFGGYKKSGSLSRDQGTEAMNQYLQTKTIWIRHE